MADWNYPFGGGKIELPREVHKQDPRDLYGGCGNPNCEQCYPKDGSRVDNRMGSPGDMASTRNYDATSEYMLREISRMQDRMWSSPSFASAPPQDEEYNKLRTKVEKYLLQADHTVGWDEVIGNDTARTALLEAIEYPVKHAELYQHYGMKLSKGCMLFGPPGCGKTMFGKAAASALSKLHGKAVELLLINGPSIQTPFVGQTEAIIRDIFAYARAYKKKHGHQLVIFIDEADAILPSRDGRPDWNASNVATFLTEMDGMEDSGAFVMLATNRPNVLDAALLRDGRCDRKIKVERPSHMAAVTILERAVAGMPSVESFPELAAKTVEYMTRPDHALEVLVHPETLIEYRFTLAHILNGAMVVGLANRAKGIAFRRDLATGTRSGVCAADMMQAVDEVFEENKGLNHTYALGEWVATLAAEVIPERIRAKMN